MYVRIHDHAPVTGTNQTCRQMMHQLATLGFGQSAGVQPQPQTVQLSLRHRTLQAQQEPIVEVARIVDAVAVANQRIEQGAELQQPMPIRTVACQARYFVAHDDSHLAKPHIGHQLLEVLAAGGVLRREALISVDHGNLIRLPAQFPQPLPQRTLVDGALVMMAHLLGIRLSQVDHGLAIQVTRHDLRGTVHVRPPP
jgi:hypothetical protein